jgi:hypothetical protein
MENVRMFIKGRIMECVRDSYYTNIQEQVSIPIRTSIQYRYMVNVNAPSGISKNEEPE